MLITFNGIDVHTFIQHSGVPGMRWGVRRYQNKDGSLTEAGKKRYKTSSESSKHKTNVDQVHDDVKKTRLSTMKKVAIGVGIGATIAASAYIAYKRYNNPSNIGSRRNEITTKTLQNIAGETGQSRAKRDLESVYRYYQPETQQERVARIQSMVERRMATENAKTAVRQTTATPAPKNLADFKTRRVAMMRSDGKIDTIDLPIDTKGYAKVFAEQMSKGNANDYNYHYKYMMNLLTRYGGSIK